MQLTGVFVVEREIPEIGARPGDRIVLRPWAPRPALLQRALGVHETTWAFSDRSQLIFTRPHLPHPLALRYLQDHPPRPPRPRHLRVME